MSEIAEVVATLVGHMQGELDSAVHKVGAEVREMLAFIAAAKAEISSIQPDVLCRKDIPGATDELDAIVQHTEEAAGQIMDCAEQVTEIAATLTPSPVADQLNAISTRIFEASSFQDITGQRVTKVIAVLKQIEQRLAALSRVVGDTASVTPHIVEATDSPPDDRSLLNGPQLVGVGNNQGDIDALFADFD